MIYIYVKNKNKKTHPCNFTTSSPNAGRAFMPNNSNGSAWSSIGARSCWVESGCCCGCGGGGVGSPVLVVLLLSSLLTSFVWWLQAHTCLTSVCDYFKLTLAWLVYSVMSISVYILKQSMLFHSYNNTTWVLCDSYKLTPAWSVSKIHTSSRLLCHLL